MKCPNCQAQNRSQARFCSHCGSLLTSEPPRSQEQNISGDGNLQIGSVDNSQVNIGWYPPQPQPSSPAQRPTEPVAVSPPPDQPISTVFKLALIPQTGSEFEVRALETPMGEPHATSRVPYTAEELIAILKLLRAAEEFSPDQLESLERLGLMVQGRPVATLHERIGQQLYEALLPKELHTAFQMTLNQTRPDKSAVALQLRFDEQAVGLAQYPWELLYYRRALLPSDGVELTRYISYPEAVPSLPVNPPLRLLYLQPRPVDLPDLPSQSEQDAVRQALIGLETKGLLSLETPAQATFDALLDELENKQIDLIHFDGHGIFARQCPLCRAMNFPHITHCQNQSLGASCGQDLSQIEPRGYLAFEKPGTRQIRWIHSDMLGQLLFNQPLRLVVLSACRSGSVGGTSLFGGTAPALIQAGVPAVLSTQLPITVDSAIKFMEGFYRALARFESLPSAVNSGRRRLLETGEWFIPTLYLRSKDNQGYLFQRKEL